MRKREAEKEKKITKKEEKPKMEEEISEDYKREEEKRCIKIGG